MRSLFVIQVLAVIILGSAFLALTPVQAWAPQRVVSGGVVPRPTNMARSSSHVLRLSAQKTTRSDTDRSFDPLNLAAAAAAAAADAPMDNTTGHQNQHHPPRALWIGAAIPLFGTPAVASAATSASDAIPSALAAYAHYLALLLMTGSIMTERLTVKPAMSIEDEKLLGTADILTGVAGILLLVSGYYRATAYGKGWDFYSHEPLFWLKLALLGIFGGLSLFPTITIIQRTVQIQQAGTIEPMSEALAARMKQVLNAELTALASIPLTASLMARGVGYMDDFPTQIVGPTLFALITAGAVYKYVKDAISWKEEGVAVPVAEDDL